MFWFAALLGIVLQSAAVMIVLSNRTVVTIAGEIFGISVHLGQTAVVLGYKRTVEWSARIARNDREQKVNI
jgi:hypothetical protein